MPVPLKINRFNFKRLELTVAGEAEKQAKLWSQYVDHPVEFTKDFIFRDTGFELSWQQVKLLQAIADNLRVTCRAATGVGKSATLACAIQWFLATRPQPYIPCTAPTLPQLKDVLWTEIARWLNKSQLRHLIKWEAEKITLRADPITSYAVGRTAREAQSLAGRHAHHMMFVADEASVIRNDIFEVIEGCLTHDDNRFVMIGNPTQISGYFYDSFHDDADDWCKLHFSGEDSPLVKPESLARLIRKYGKDSDIYRVRGLGEFPKGNPDSFIQLADVEAAMMREVEIIPGAPFEIGVDVARGGGNLTAVHIRQGNKGDFPIECESKSTIPGVARMVLGVVKKYRELLQYEGIVRVKIDDTGLGGGVTDILKEDVDNKLLIIPCLSGAVGAKTDEQYADKASAMWGELKDQLKYISLPTHVILDGNLQKSAQLKEELSTRKVSYPGGRIKIQSKEDFKKDYGDSPDHADCTVLSFAKSLEKKRVLSFSKYNPLHQRDFKINWRLLLKRQAKVYMSIHQDEDLVTTLLMWLWDGYDGHLYLFDEIIARDPRPENIVPRAVMKMREQLSSTDIKMAINQLQWYCNPEMCGITGSSKSGMKNARDGVDTQWSQQPFGIGLMPNLTFDLYGSISLMASMFAKGMITIHSRCSESSRQFSDWCIEQNGKPGETNTGACMAMGNIVHLLHEWGHSKKFLTKLLPYTPESERARKMIEDADRDGTIFNRPDLLFVPGQRRGM